MPPAPAWSFIVPAHDEAPLIQATLQSIRDAADACGFPYECIVVDDDSTDNTAQVARACGACVVPVAFRHIAATRNAGAAAALGARLCFVDADTRAAFDATGGFDTAYYAGEDVAFSRALAGVGRIAILRETVRTSDRKLRTFGVPDHLRLMLRFALRGRRILHSRDHLGLWYDK